MSIPEDHLAKFNKMTDAKEMWEAIKSRFGGNDESKKMQKYILKQQFESFSVSNSEGSHKGYERFQSLLSQLEIDGAGVSTEDDNRKFLRSLPASWSQVSLIMRTKPGVDTLSFDDLYNNIRFFESDVKGSTASSSSTQNVAFVSSESTSSTNDVSIAYGVSTSSGHNLQKKGSSSYTDELKYSFFDNQSSGPQLDHEDLEQVDEFDLEEIDLKWQVAMIFMRLKKFYKNTGRKLQFDAKEPVDVDKTKVECFNCHNTWHFARECRSKGNQESRRRDAGNTGYKAKDKRRRPGKQEEPKALVTIDGDGVDWTGHAEDEQENFALWLTTIQAQTLREQLGDASIEIQAYTQALKSQMSAKDKSGLGYGDQIHEGVLSYENEVLESVFDSRSSDVKDSPVYDRFVKVEGMHAVPPPMTGIYMRPKFDFRIDESNFTYDPKKSKTSESVNTSDYVSCESNSSVETLEYVPKPAVNEPKAVSKPKVWFNAPIIEEYESDNDDEYVIKPLKEQKKPSFAFVNTVKHVKTPRETVKEQNTCSPSPKADKRDWNGLMSKKLGLGYGFTKKACFVCGSFSHLIRDCDFHEKRMAKQVELNKQKGKGTGQGENRPVWNNVQRLNHQNKFVPKAVLTKTGIFPVNTARQNLSSQAAATSTARKVNTARPIVNEIRPRNNFYKSHSPIRRPSNRTTAPKANFTNHKVNTARDKTVSAVGGIWETTNSRTRTLLNSVGQKGSRGNTVMQYFTIKMDSAKVLVTKPQNKAPYELITGKISIISYIRPFGCHVTILNTIDHLGKFEGKYDEGFLVRYSLNSKAFRVYNLETNRVEENMHIKFLENKPNVAGKGPNWLFDLDYLTDSMNFQPVRSENQANKTAGPEKANHSAGTQDNIDAGNSKIETDHTQDYFVLPIYSSYTLTDKSSKVKNEELERLKRQEKEANDAAEVLRKEFAQSTEDLLLQVGAARATSTNTIDTVSTPLSTANPSKNLVLWPDFINLESTVNVSPIPTSRIHSIHPTTEILGDPKSAVETRSKVNKISGAH
ncbi:putative ribonuclease H-like domain-containing protein [Tanacetum coccineum]